METELTYAHQYTGTAVSCDTGMEETGTHSCNSECVGCIRECACCFYHCALLYIFAGFVLLPLGIGILTGSCDPKTDQFCMNYIPIHATAYQYSVTNRTCTDCASYAFEQCNRFVSYDCFSSFAEFHYDGDHYCYIQTAKDEVSREFAQNLSYEQFTLKRTILLYC